MASIKKDVKLVLVTSDDCMNLFAPPFDRVQVSVHSTILCMTACTTSGIQTSDRWTPNLNNISFKYQNHSFFILENILWKRRRARQVVSTFPSVAKQYAVLDFHYCIM
jgi:hypothetical protein